MITWKRRDGSTITVDRNINDDLLRRILEEAIKTMKGQYPSINSKDTIYQLSAFAMMYLQDE